MRLDFRYQCVLGQHYNKLLPFSELNQLVYLPLLKNGNVSITPTSRWNVPGKNKTVLQAAERRDVFLQLDAVTGSLTLKQNHHYWHQIHGNLPLTGANTCHLAGSMDHWWPCHPASAERPNMGWSCKSTLYLHLCTCMHNMCIHLHYSIHNSFNASIMWRC